jgi:hypothetical protein
MTSLSVPKGITISVKRDGSGAPGPEHKQASLTYDLRAMEHLLQYPYQLSQRCNLRIASRRDCDKPHKHANGDRSAIPPEVTGESR